MDCSFCRKKIKKDIVKCIPCEKLFHPSCHGLHKVVDISGHLTLCKGESTRLPSSPGTDVFVDASSSVPTVTSVSSTTVTTTTTTSASTTSFATAVPSPTRLVSAVLPPAPTTELSSLCADVRAVLIAQGEVRTLLQSHTLKLNQCTSFISTQQAHNTTIEKSIATLTADINLKFQAMTQDYAVMSSKIAALETSLENLKMHVDSIQLTAPAAASGMCPSVSFSDLTSRIKRIEQEQISGDLLISGVPEHSGEDLMSLMIKLAGTLQVPITPSDVSQLRRLPSARIQSANKPRTIFIRFSSPVLKQTLLTSRRRKGRVSANEIDSSFPGTIVRINEFLPRESWTLLNFVRAAARERDYQFTWYSRGNIYVKKERNSSPILIHHEKDIEDKML